MPLAPIPSLELRNRSVSAGCAAALFAAPQAALVNIRRNTSAPGLAQQHEVPGRCTETPMKPGKTRRWCAATGRRHAGGVRQNIKPEQAGIPARHRPGGTRNADREANHAV